MLTSNRKSSFILPLPLLIVILFVVLLILLYWIKKEDYGIISISLFILCLSSFFLGKGIELKGNQYFVYVQFFCFRKIKKNEIYEEGIKKLFLNEINGRMEICSSIPRASRGGGYSSIYINYYVLVIKTHTERVITVLKSENYGYVLKYAKLFSKYYDIPISVNDIDIKYSATGDLVDEWMGTSESKITEPKITCKKYDATEDVKRKF